MKKHFVRKHEGSLAQRNRLGGWDMTKIPTTGNSMFSQVFGSIGLLSMISILIFSERLPRNVVLFLTFVWVVCGGMIAWNFLRENSLVNEFEGDLNEKQIYLLYANRFMNLSRKAVLPIAVFYIIGFKFLMEVSVLIMFVCIFAWVYFVYKEMRTKL